MKPYKVTIAPNAGPRGYGSHAIHIDGHDVSRGVRSLHMDLEGGRPAHIRLEMLLCEVERMEFETPDLYIPEATRDALIKLGWTPPKEET